MTKPKKLRWVEAQGMKYVRIPEVDDCTGCDFDKGEMYCGQVICKGENGNGWIYIPLEVQHIPHLTKKGKKLNG